jgi:GNAT superfamily N-acetyltransferase
MRKCPQRKNALSGETVLAENAAEVVVRSIEPRDAQQVSLLSEQLGYQRAPEEVLAWIEHLEPGCDNQAAFVACLGSEIAGWIEVSIERRLQSPPSALIGGLVVKDGLRGRGIGRRLCEQAEAWSWEQKVSRLRVTSRSTRPEAHRFYLQDGYREVKTSLVFEKDAPEEF